MTWDRPLRPSEQVVRLAAGCRDEDMVAGWLSDLGWDHQPFGARAWDPTLPPPAVSGPGVQWAITHSRYPIRWAPDLIAGRADGRAMFVEVVNDARGPNRMRELAKRNALDAWAAILPVVIVDVGMGTAVEHRPHVWTSDVLRTSNGRGSGAPYVLEHRDDERPWWEVLT